MFTNIYMHHCCLQISAHKCHSVALCQGYKSLKRNYHYDKSLSVYKYHHYLQVSKRKYDCDKSLGVNHCHLQVSKCKYHCDKSMCVNITVGYTSLYVSIIVTNHYLYVNITVTYKSINVSIIDTYKALYVSITAAYTSLNVSITAYKFP